MQPPPHVGGTNVAGATIQAPVSLSQNGGFEFDLLSFRGQEGAGPGLVRPHCPSIFEHPFPAPPSSVTMEPPVAPPVTSAVLSTQEVLIGGLCGREKGLQQGHKSHVRASHC